MGKILIITEKPSVAKDIASVLKIKTKKDGYFENDTYVISWAIGHLVGLLEPEEYDAIYKKWEFNNLPIIPEQMQLKSIGRTKDQFTILKKLMKRKDVDSFICATDSGREGELIFRYIYELVGSQKPFKRLWISSMTPASIMQGFSNLKDGTDYDNLYDSARCRSESDWLVGMNATRAYTVKYGVMLSVGRVQTPTLALIVKKQQEIEAFQSEAYLEIQCFFDGFFGMWIDAEEKTRIKNQKEAEDIAKKMSKQEANIIKVETEEKRILPPLLYDLTELQREANQKFGFSAKQTLDIAQALYEKHKFITYPRTDSRYLSDDMKSKVQTTLQSLKKEATYEPHITFLENNQRIIFSKRIIDNTKITDHHAIIPTEKKPNLTVLNGQERAVYTLIVARFFAVFHLPYVYEVTKAYLSCMGERIFAKGVVVTQEGFKGLEKAMLPTKSKRKEKEQQLPPLQQGEVYLLEKVDVLQKQTQPPKPYTESTLLSAMEHAGRLVEDETIKEQLKEGGLGTPATRASIIERLLSVGYIKRNGKNLMPTEKGVRLIAVVPEALCSAETTGKWEKGLSSIAKGRMNTEKFMKSIENFVCFLVHDVQNRETGIVFPEEAKYGGKYTAKKKPQQKQKSLGVCPMCGKGEIWENTKAFYCTEWQNDCKFNLWKSFLYDYDAVLTKEMVKELLLHGKIEEIIFSSKHTNVKKQGTLILDLKLKNKLSMINIKEL